MGSFTTGSVVLVPFPFSDISKSKLRPAVILAKISNNDYILCQVTSKVYSSKNVIVINNVDFLEGSLKKKSYARPEKLFTANRKLIISEIGLLKIEKINKITNSVINILNDSLNLREKELTKSP